MANILDYILWRGDLSFDADELNELDALVFTQLSYLNFQSIVPEDFSNPISLNDACANFLSCPDFKTRKNLGLVINKDILKLLKAAAASRRFSDIKLCCYVDKYDESTEEQFSAITFCNDKNKLHSNWNFIAFRGTDDTLVGWKEDFNLAYLDEVPSQIDAKIYLETVAEKLKNNIYVGGHSKGGNLAVYAASNIPKKLQAKIITVYNQDSPGFSKSFFENEKFLNIKNKISSFVPQLSIVGMLFSNSGDYVTVKTSAHGIFQHDPISWQVLGNHFVELDDINNSSRYISKTVNDWFLELSMEQREVFVEATFNILFAARQKTNKELFLNFASSSFEMLKAMKNLDKKTRKTLEETINLLFKYAISNIAVLAK